MLSKLHCFKVAVSKTPASESFIFNVSITLMTSLYVGALPIFEA